jgi:hypothetical protein
VPWGWIVLAVVLVALAILVALLITRSRRQGRQAEWRRSALSAVGAAEIARDLVLNQAPSDDAQRRASVAGQVDEAAGSLEQLAGSAVDESEGALSGRSAASLRGLAFAVEADHLMRSGGEHPTGAQLAAADQERRSRLAEFDSALAQLKRSVTPESSSNRR